MTGTPGNSLEVFGHFRDIQVGEDHGDDRRDGLAIASSSDLLSVYGTSIGRRQAAVHHSPPSQGSRQVSGACSSSAEEMAYSPEQTETAVPSSSGSQSIFGSSSTFPDLPVDSGYAGASAFAARPSALAPSISSLERLRRLRPRLIPSKKARREQVANGSLTSSIERVDPTSLHTGPNMLKRSMVSRNSVKAVSDDAETSLPSAIPLPQSSSSRVRGAGVERSRRNADGSKISRPPNPWILYRSAQIQALKTQENFSKVPQSEVSKLISYMWRDETSEVRKKYEDLAAEAKSIHALQYPDYAYRPTRKQRMTPDSASEPAPTRDRLPASLAGIRAESYSSEDIPDEAPAPLQTRSVGSGEDAAQRANIFRQLDSIDFPWALGADNLSGPEASLMTTSTLEQSVHELIASLNSQASTESSTPMSIECDSTFWNSPHSATTSSEYPSPFSPTLEYSFDSFGSLSAPAAYATFDFETVSTPAVEDPRPLNLGFSEERSNSSSNSSGQLDGSIAGTSDFELAA